MPHRRLLIAGLAASTILPRVAQSQTWNQQFGNVAVDLLARWITASRQQALAAGTEPVPPLIAEGLAGYFRLAWGRLSAGAVPAPPNSPWLAWPSTTAMPPRSR